MDSGILYLVATPIGNLGDITFRAIETLKTVDFIVAEDTRVTIKLLNHYEIKNKLISYHKFSDQNKIQQIINKILSGQNCALVSDAGMPCISDPGEQVVKIAQQNGIRVSVIPGACAAVSGLAISGIVTSKFKFEGFLSTNKKNRLESLNQLKNERSTIIFYEAPHKLKATLKDLFNVLGNRNIAIIKEITKIHETVFRLTLKEAIDYFESLEKIKGEFVLALEGSKETDKNITLKEATEMVVRLHNESDTPLSETIKAIAEKTGHKKNVLYKAVISQTKTNQ